MQPTPTFPTNKETNKERKKVKKEDQEKKKSCRVIVGGSGGINAAAAAAAEVRQSVVRLVLRPCLGAADVTARARATWLGHLPVVV